MRVDSLDELKRAFEEWRVKKRHAREAVPAALVERARRTAEVHGPRPVARAAKLDGRRLMRASGSPRREGGRTEPKAPGYSRVEVGTSAVGRPPAEAGTPNGVKVRVYVATAEMLALLTAASGGGGR